MSDVLYTLLLEMRNNRPNDIYVFTNPKTNNKYTCINRAFSSLCKLADVKNFRFHDLRHTGATRMVACGVPLPVVKEILNHAKIQTTMRYSHTLYEQKVNAVNTLAHYNNLTHIVRE